MRVPDTGQTSRKLCPVFRLPASQGNKRQRGQRQLDVLQEVQLGHAELHNKNKIRNRIRIQIGSAFSKFVVRFPIGIRIHTGENRIHTVRGKKCKVEDKTSPFGDQAIKQFLSVPLFSCCLVKKYLFKLYFFLQSFFKTIFSKWKT